MKRLILLLCFSVISGVAVSPHTGNYIYIEQAMPMRPYEAIWEAICQVESGGNPRAIGDKHLKNKSYGIAQVRQDRLDDYYKQTGIRYTTDDMFDTTNSKSVFMWYAMQYHYTEIEKISRNWNGGPKGYKKPSTLKYYRKILLSL